jgi:hypothetical protein
VHIFISHATANAALAEALADALMTAEGVTTFLSSRAGDIRADEAWVQSIERALQRADVYIIVLTPESILRPWVNFEAGAAWFSGRQTIFVRINALPAGDVPLPIASRQTYALDDLAQFGAVSRALGITIDNPEAWVARFAQRAIAPTSNVVDEGAWEGIEISGAFFVWAGPLLNLEDRPETPPPPGLMDAIRGRGLAPRWVNMSNIAERVERGLAQVFATDRHLWRRPVTDRGRVLMVGSPHI